MVLIISSYYIIHPDTVAYHCQSILWMKNYKAIPGTAHLKLELGFQSMWFALQAIFMPSYKGMTTSFYVNGAVLCWYFIFVIQKINLSLAKESNASNKTHGGGWFLLLIFTLISWTQVRLTAASASPDFIVTLFICASVYTFMQYSKEEQKHSFLFLSAMFCCAAFAIKLSAIIILFLLIAIAVYFIRKKRTIDLSLLLFFLFFWLAPVLIRNVVAAGYPLYPSSFANFFHYDWKLSQHSLINFQKYITTYARFPVDSSDVEKSLSLPILKWVPIWWQHLAIIDRLLLLIILLGLVSNIFFLKRFLKTIKKNILPALIVFFGTIFWFMKAPDPRFGTGFLVCSIYFLYLPFLTKEVFKKYFYKASISILLVLLIFYSGYRFINFFNRSQIISPEGVKEVMYKSDHYNDLKINVISNDSTGCGATPVPCVMDTNFNFIPRGKTVEHGFKERR
jgi:hypothetical protein